KVVFDPSKVTYKQLVDGFFIMHDPTQLNRQGPDVGTQYRSAVFCTSAEQEAVVKATIQELKDKRAFGGRAIVTQVAQGGVFTPAEEYHQNYVATTGRFCHVTNPWPTVLGTEGKSPAAETPQKRAAPH
ncbi:MAG: peptide-methionine (S)-S-oxide reductase, partial [Phycisphaerae bacterium]|nr:peptide-methionine (S)-S-oxide reductase [Phycisphaerae bacterium]